MTAKHFFSGSILFLGSSILSAESAEFLHSTPLDTPNTFNAVRLLEQNALLALIGAVSFMGLVWLCSVLDACAGLEKSKKSTRRTSMKILPLIVGLSVFFGSCSAEKRAMATQYRIAAAAEQRTCPLRHHYGSEVNTFSSNSYSSTSYSNSYGPVFCKYCGYMISHGH